MYVIMVNLPESHKDTYIISIPGEGYKVQDGKHTLQTLLHQSKMNISPDSTWHGRISMTLHQYPTYYLSLNLRYPALLLNLSSATKAKILTTCKLPLNLLLAVPVFITPVFNNMLSHGKRERC